jgi:hypothetical protein
VKPLRVIFGEGGDDEREDEYEVLPREQSLELARAMLDRLHGIALTKREPTEGGICDDCKHMVAVRWRFGRVVLCRRCVLLRMEGATALTRTEVGLDVSERSPVAREYALLEQLGKDGVNERPTEEER